jgi:ribosome biogenesis SPOUT family RNA methylase Rps3
MSKEKVFNPKYWIETGQEVIHRDLPEQKMYVDKIVKTTKLIKEGDKTKTVTFVIGVDCHWINNQGNFASGKFLTMELLPWDKTKREQILAHQTKQKLYYHDKPIV